MAADSRIYPFNVAEVKEDKADRCTITFFLQGLTSKHQVDASIQGRQLIVRTTVNGKLHESRPTLPGEVQEGKLAPKVKDGRVHVSFKKLENFRVSAVRP